MEEGVYLKFYVPELDRHGGELLYEWLLRRARDLGIGGGSAFRAVAGYGRHGVLHEQTFFELQGELPVEVAFLTTDALADRLLAAVTEEGLRLFHSRSRALFGVTGS